MVEWKRCEGDGELAAGFVSLFTPLDHDIAWKHVSDDKVSTACGCYISFRSQYTVVNSDYDSEKDKWQ